MTKQKISNLSSLGQFRVLESENVTDRLVQSIKMWILRGMIAPGERFPPERELAAKLKVSRSSLRQALKVLEVMGVLQARQGSGTYLTEAAETILRQPSDLLMPLKGVTFGELFEARRAMEIEAAAAAAQRASQEDIAELESVVKHMHRHLSHPAAYFAGDVAFHKKIAQISGNGVFVWFHEMVGKVMADVWQKRAQQGDNTVSTFTEHKAIFEAIRQRDPVVARLTMLEHLGLAKFYSHEPTRLELRVVGPQDAVA